MLNKIQFLILFSIILFGLLVRLYKIDNPIADWHSWRQGDTASVTRIYIDYGLDLLHPKYQDISYLQTGVYNPEGYRFVEFPVFNAVHFVVYKAFPQIPFEMWGRLVSVFCSTVSIALVFVLGKRFLGTLGGFISAFLFAFVPFNIYFSRVILPEPMSVVFVLAALVFFVRWIDRGMVRNLIISSVFFSLALLVKPYTIFYGLTFVWLALYKHNFAPTNLLRDKKLWFFGIISFVPLVFWRIWMGQYPEGIPFYHWVFNLFGIRFKPSFWYWIFGQRLGDMILGVWMVPLFLFGVLSKSKNNEFWFPHIMGISMLFYVSVIAAANVRHDYYQTIIIPAVVFLVAKGALVLWESKEFFQPLAKVAILVCVVWGLYFPWNQTIKGFYQINHPEIISAGKALDEIAPKGARVVAPYNGDTALLYQTKRMGWPIQQQPVEELVSLGADYYVSVNLNDPQTQDAMRKFEIPIQNDQFVIIDLNKKRMPKG